MPAEPSIHAMPYMPCRPVQHQPHQAPTSPRRPVEQTAANPLLDEIEALQDQVLADLNQLNQRIESVLKVHLATEAAEDAAQIKQHDLPAVIQPPYLHLTTFLPARIAG